MDYSLVIKRANGQRIDPKTIRQQVDYIVKRSLTGARGRGWKVRARQMGDPIQENGLWLYKFKLKYDKISGHKNIAPEQFEQIKDVIAATGLTSRFGKYAWLIEGKETGDIEHEALETTVEGVKDVSFFETVKQWKDIQIPEELLTNDDALSRSEFFNEIYGRGAQIRVILSALKAAQETDGLRRGHCAMWGHPACGKTKVLLAIEKMLGDGSVLRLDATSTTRAGLEKLFFHDLKNVPPVVVMEEVEKANEDALKIWLGALDDRGEIRKVNFRETKVRELRIVFLCTVNNKRKFDLMMGSDGTEAGALSSRCVNQIYFPRPDKDIMRLILTNDVNRNGGKSEWIEPALILADELGIDDPRKVLSFLAGGDRLLTREFQQDILKIAEQELTYA